LVCLVLHLPFQALVVLSLLCSSLFLCRLPWRKLFPYTTLFRCGIKNHRGRNHGAGQRTTAGLVTPGHRPAALLQHRALAPEARRDRKRTPLNSSHVKTSYAVVCFEIEKAGKALLAGTLRVGSPA